MEQSSDKRTNFEINSLLESIYWFI